MVETNSAESLSQTLTDAKQKKTKKKVTESLFYSEYSKSASMECPEDSELLKLKMSAKKNPFAKKPKGKKGDDLIDKIAYIFDETPASSSFFYDTTDSDLGRTQSARKSKGQRPSNCVTPVDSLKGKKQEQKINPKQTNIPVSDPLFDYIINDLIPNNQQPKRREKSHRITDQPEENHTPKKPKNKNKSHGPKLLSHLKSESPTKPAYPLYEDSNSISFERASGSSDGQYRGDQLGSPGERDAPDSLSKTNFLKFNSNDGDSSNNFSISSIEKSGSQGREIPLENKKISNLMQEFPDSGGIQNAEGKKLTINRARSEKISGLAGKLGNIDITKTMGPSSGMGSLKLRRAATNAPSSYDQTSPVPVEFTVESPESPHSLVDTIKSRPKSFHSNKRPPSRKFLRDTLVKQNDSSLSGDLLFGFEDPSPTTERPLSNFENLDSVSQAPESSVLSAEDFFSVEEVSEYQKKSDELLKGFDSLRD